MLYVVSADIAPQHWKHVGRHLGFSEPQLDTLQFDCRHSGHGHQEVVYQMLRDWHERCGRDATLPRLARTLIDSGLGHVATKLQRTDTAAAAAARR